MPLPTAAETHLLRAALLPRKPALEAFAVWRERLDFQALNLGSQRVLALLHKNLHSFGVEDPLMERLRGIARYAWFSNQSLIAQVQPLQADFRRAGIPLMFLKGMAIVASVPGQLALRPMGDADLLVPPEHAARAMDVLIASGWWAYYGNIDFVKREVLKRAEGYGFEKGKHLYLDLHWQMLKLSRWQGADDRLWSRALTARLGDQPCLVPGYEDQVLHACVHGAPWDPNGSLRWAADSVVILRHAREKFDWNHFVDEAGERRVLAPVAACVRYLRDRLDIDVPQATIDRLAGEPLRRAERIDVKLRGAYPPGLSAPATAFLEFQNWRHGSRELTYGSVGTAMLAWLRSLWAVDGNVAAVSYTMLQWVRGPRMLRAAIYRAGRRQRTLAGRRLAAVIDGPLDLSLSGDCRESLLHGWSDPEAEGRWTRAKDAAIALDVSGAPALRLTLHMQAMTVRGRSLRVEVWANSVCVANWLLEDADAAPGQRNIDIPTSVLNGRPLVLTFVMDTPVSPKSLGLSDDERVLGLFVHRLSFDLAPEATGSH